MHFLFLYLHAKVIPFSVSHARGIYLLDRLLLVATKLIDNCEGDRCPAVVDLHTVVLVALHGTGIVFIVEDVVAIKAQSPSSIMRRPLQFGIHAEDWTDVVDTLYSLCLIERIKDETEILRATEFYGCGASKDDRQLLAVERQVKEMVALVVLVGSHDKHVAVEPLACIEDGRGL